MTSPALAGLLLSVALWGSALGQIADVVRIGVLTDETGPASDRTGPGSVTAARMAAEDFGGAVRGKPIEILHADTKNDPEVATATARRWFDEEKVGAVIDLPSTPVALAVQEVGRQKGRTVMITAAAASEFTSRFCSPVSTHWADDTHALAAGTARAVLAQGGDSWFFVTLDQPLGLALERDAADAVKAGSGKVLGAARHAAGATDETPLLREAQASGAKVVGLASLGADLATLLRQAKEAGMASNGGPALAALLVDIEDVHALGLEAAQGLQFTSGFYWDSDDASRAFAQRFFAREGAMPSRDHALVYTAVTQYLRAVDAVGTDEAVAVNRVMRDRPFTFFAKPASIRADGRVLYDETLFRVKAPGESHAPWDYYAPVRTTPAADAFLPPSREGCGR